MSNNPGVKQEWLENSAADKSDLFVAKKIMAEIDDLNDFQPNQAILQEFDLNPSELLHLLDFGAGMLRNTVGLLEMSDRWHVTAYDIAPLMLARGIKHFNKRLRLNVGRYSTSTDFNFLSKYRFDAIICLIVLQHIEPEPLTQILAAFRKMTNKLCVYGRRALDDLEVRPENWTPKWDIIFRQWVPTKLFAIPPQDYIDVQKGQAEDHFGAILKPLE